MIRKTSLQQLIASHNDKKLEKQVRETPLTESQKNPQTRKLAAMQALRRPPRRDAHRDPNQLTLAEAPDGQEFLQEHNASVRAMRSAAVDNFRFREDNTRVPRFTGDIRKPFERRGTPIVNPEQLREHLINTGLPNQALEALGTTIYATNKIPIMGRFSSGPGPGAFHRRGLIEIDSTAHGGDYADDTEQFKFTLAHELGHVAESLARGRVGYGEGDREWEEDGKLGPSASAEGFADGIGRRFRSKEAPTPTGPDDPWHRYFEGYHPERWTEPENQAAFVAHRAHAWATGELPEGSLPERMHKMALNPHVRDALDAADHDRLEHLLGSPVVIIRNSPQNESSGAVFDQDAPDHGHDHHGHDERLSGFVSLKNVARNLSDQFMETRKTGRQLSLLGEEYEYDTYDVDEIDWDN